MLCLALNKRAAGAAGKLFEARLVSKLYLALVEGHPKWEHLRVERGVGGRDRPRTLAAALQPLLPSLTLAPILHPGYHPLRSCSCYGPLPGEDGTDARGFRMALEGAEGRRLPLQPLALTANHSPLLHPLARLHSAARRRH